MRITIKLICEIGVNPNPNDNYTVSTTMHENVVYYKHEMQICSRCKCLSSLKSVRFCCL